MSQSHLTTSKPLNKGLFGIVKKDSTLRGELEDAQICNDVAYGINNLRIRAEMTQKELAEILQVKQSNISRWEQMGYQGYKVKMLSKIARVLGGHLNITFDYPSPSYSLTYSMLEGDTLRFSHISGIHGYVTNPKISVWKLEPLMNAHRSN